MIAVDRPARSRPRRYRVVTIIGGKRGEHEVVAYDAADAVMQSEHRLSLSDDVVDRVEPAEEPGPEFPREWGGVADAMQIMGLKRTATRARLAVLEADYGLPHLGSKSSKRWHLPSIPTALLKMSADER